MLNAAFVRVVLADADGKVEATATGNGMIDAAARAYLNAVNKIVRLRDRPDTRLPVEGP